MADFVYIYGVESSESGGGGLVITTHDIHCFLERIKTTEMRNHTVKGAYKIEVENGDVDATLTYAWKAIEQSSKMANITLPPVLRLF